LARSVSVGAKPSLSSGVGGGRSGDRRSTVSMESTQSEKVSTPRTLAEKWAHYFSLMFHNCVNILFVVV
jgi:hypothetical protein